MSISNVLATKMSVQLYTNDSLSTDYLLINQSLELFNISNTTTPVIDFQLIEIYAIVIPFLLAVVANITMTVSLIQAANKSQRCIRRAHTMPVVDLIILILSITTTLRLLIRSGLQVFCISGESHII